MILLFTLLLVKSSRRHVLRKLLGDGGFPVEQEARLRQIENTSTKDCKVSLWTEPFTGPQLPALEAFSAPSILPQQYQPLRMSGRPLGLRLHSD